MPYTCPKCGMTSHNPSDEIHRYCGNCRKFESEMKNTWAIDHREEGTQARNKDRSKVSRLLRKTYKLFTNGDADR